MESSGSAVSDKLGQAADVVSGRTADAVDQGRGVVQRQIGQRAGQVGSQASAVSERMRQMADQARSEGNDQHARVAEQVAGQSDRAAAYLSEVDPDQLLSDAEDFARREPWLVAAAGLTIGFLFARSLKASSSRRSTERRGFVAHSAGTPDPWPAPAADAEPALVGGVTADARYTEADYER
jgi:ElaB/YqjD/DUF883 family membrane-anchored ribosome-binding protein